MEPRSGVSGAHAIPVSRPSEAKETALRLGLAPVAYAAIGLAEVVFEGQHPLTPQVVVIGTTAASMAVLAFIACRQLLAMPAIVLLGSLPAAGHAWAVTCLDPLHDGVEAFPLTILASGLLLPGARHVGIVAAAVIAAFLAANAAACVPDPWPIAGAILVSLGAALGLAELHQRAGAGGE